MTKYLLSLLCFGISVVLITTACRTRASYQQQQTVPTNTSHNQPAVQAKPVVPAAPKAKALPRIEGEPAVRILLQHAPRVQVQLLRSGTSANASFAAQTYEFSLSNGQIISAGRSLGTRVVIDCLQGAATFSLGKRRYGGDVVLEVVDKRIALSERVSLEGLLPGILHAEVSPTWHFEALKAQAVAARTYITHQWLRRHDQAWHLAAAETVDLAYHGFIAKPTKRLQLAISQTRGDCLWYQGLPLPAFFSASSGGHTASLLEVWPDRRSADGVVNPSPALQAVPDEWAQKGAERLRRPELWQWRYQKDLAGVSWKIRSAAKAEGVALNFQALRDVQVKTRSTSGRAQMVSLIPNSGPAVEIRAADIRRWLGGHSIRSTLWTNVYVSNGNLNIEGRGFGHGVGMAQASALAMAEAGVLAPAILTFFYRGAQLRRMW